MTATFTIKPPKPGEEFNIDGRRYLVLSEPRDLGLGVWQVDVEVVR